jgi:hypothetical protein
MPEIRFDDASKLAASILKDEFQCDPNFFWDEWEHCCLSLLTFPWTKEVFLVITDLFQCARNICSLGKNYQDSAKYSFFNIIDRELLKIASMGIERMLKESDFDIKLRKNAINMALQSLSNMMTNNPIIIKLLWPKVLNCSFLLA